ncbi:MAG: ribosome assembly cofactor RimP [Alistipes sp.]|jgi:ribosome maturation factor RimP|nr:ribosome assembly cofactor RimP [Alistipes sp.]
MVDPKDITVAVNEVLAEMAEAVAVDGETSGGGELSDGSEFSGGGLFLVEVKAHGDEIEVFVDCDARGADGRPRGVRVEDCAAITKAVEARFDRDVEDFSLTVSSAGIGQPLRVARQFRKLVGRQVEVAFGSGAKILATLVAFDEGNITLIYSEKQKVEGKKRPEIVEVTKTFSLDDVKAVREHIDFK